MLEAPFGRDGRVAGTMYFTRHPDAPAFGERDLDALAIVTRHMATAVEHCDAYRQATAAVNEARRPAREPFDHLEGVLSKREVQVLALVARGLGTADIARQLYLSPNTVKYHLKRLFAALGATSRAELVAKALAPPSGVRPKPLSRVAPDPDRGGRHLGAGAARRSFTRRRRRR